LPHRPTKKSPKSSSKQPVPESKPKPKAFHFKARNDSQKTFVEKILKNDITFGIGSAGCGKTLVAVAQAVAALNIHEVEKIIVVRPAVEAGSERLGFLPGELGEKLAPYMTPVVAALDILVGKEGSKALQTSGKVEFMSLAYMRGVTLNNAFVLLDEAQNTTVDQMMMALTRLGINSKMVITGDPTQRDIPTRVTSGLDFAKDVLGDLDGVEFVYFNTSDVVRHRLVGQIIDTHREWKDRL
jgi:phosphate starvation-inducible PhoH-like protein